MAKGLQGHLAEEDLRAFQHYVSAVFDQLSFGEIDTEEAENRIFWELKDYFRSY